MGRNETSKEQPLSKRWANLRNKRDAEISDLRTRTKDGAKTRA